MEDVASKCRLGDIFYCNLKQLATIIKNTLFNPHINKY